MRGKALKRYAILLIVMICISEFSDAKYVSRPNKLKIEKERQDNNDDNESGKVPYTFIK